MIVEAAGTFLALLALLVLLAVVALLIVAVFMRRAGADWWPVRMVEASGLGAAAAVTGVATMGSLYYSEVVGFVPCELCWAQRIFAYPLAVVLTVALVRSVRGVGDPAAVWPFAVPLAALGLPISVYHWLVEHAALPSGACDPTNPCSVIWLERFGFVSLPFMAGCAFAFVLAVALVLHRARRLSTEQVNVPAAGARGPAGDQAGALQGPPR